MGCRSRKSGSKDLTGHSTNRAKKIFAKAPAKKEKAVTLLIKGDAPKKLTSAVAKPCVKEYYCAVRHFTGAIFTLRPVVLPKESGLYMREILELLSRNLPWAMALATNTTDIILI